MEDTAEPCFGATGAAIRRQVLGQLADIELDLGRASLGWVTRSGFNAAWTDFHLARSTWIGAGPTPSVLSLALGDILRLEGSDIALRPSLQADLWRAVTDIDPNLGPYVEALVPADVTRIRTAATPPAAEATPPANPAPPSGRGGLVGWLRASRGSATGASAAKATAAAKAASAAEAEAATERERRARVVVASVHTAVNDYRGSRWAQLARSRWQLVLTTTIAGVFGLLVLGLVLVRSVGATQLVAAWAYFLVGAVAGLFLRLRQAGEEDHVADDYGLETARLNQTPLLSGMAAVIGVLLMATLAGSTLGDILRLPEASPGPSATPTASVMAAAVSPGSEDGTVSPSIAPSPSPAATPSPSPASDAGLETSTTADLATAFDLGKYPIGLVVALIFGLTPTLVLQRLGVAATQATRDLIATRTT